MAYQVGSSTNIHDTDGSRPDEKMLLSRMSVPQIVFHFAGFVSFFVVASFYIFRGPSNLIESLLYFLAILLTVVLSAIPWARHLFKLGDK